MKHRILALTALLFFSVACKKEKKTTEPQPTGKTALQIPTEYSSDNYATNISTESGVRSRLSALATYMKKGDNIANALFADSLNALYISGSPSLQSLTLNSYHTRIDGSGGWFAEMATASTQAYDPRTPNTTGGVFGGRLLNRYGVENTQMVEKGLFSAALYNHMLTLMEGPVTEAYVDRMISIYGASQAFPNTSTAANTPTPDGFIAVYAARRDKNDGNGFYSQIKNAFLKLQAAVKAGEQYNTEKEEALAEIKLNIEKALMSTVIHYGFSAIAKLSSTSPEDVTLANGLHDLSECAGFALGLRSINPAHRKITDAQLESILSNLNFPVDANPSLHLFTTQGSTELPKINQAQELLKSIYNFSDSEMEDFKQNWISVQGR